MKLEFIEHVEEGLAVVAEFAKLALEGISILCVVIGVLKTIQLVLQLRCRNRRRRDSREFPFNRVRLRFGSWLALALECQLGADILATTVAPTLEALGKLAIVAVIRTFLNYFLDKEIEAEQEAEQEAERQNREDVPA